MSSPDVCVEGGAPPRRIPRLENGHCALRWYLAAKPAIQETLSKATDG
jgi:hypothetical protein